jgi:transposase
VGAIILKKAPLKQRRSPARRALIIAALTANPNASQVAKQTGVSKFTAWRIAKVEGIELTAGKALRGRLSADKRAQIIAALKANPIATRVAGQVGGVSQVTVWKIARAEGIELIRRHRCDAEHGSTGPAILLRLGGLNIFH